MTAKDAPPRPETIRFPLRSKGALEAYPTYLLTRLANRWALDQNKHLAELGIQGAKMRVLSCLSAMEELTINELAVLSVTEQSTTSRTVEQLVEAGLVIRKVSDQDQRIRTVMLTDAGWEKLDEISPVINQRYETLIEDIDSADLATCVNVLRQMLFKVRKNEI